MQTYNMGRNFKGVAPYFYFSRTLVNENINQKTQFINGKSNGTVEAYYENGTIRAIGFYENGERIRERNWFY